MDKLPNEILHKIFIQVPFKERLECLFVSHYWYNALYNYSLLYDIMVYNYHSLKQFIDIIQSMPSRGTQVEILNLDFTFNFRFHYQKLCNMLPNLRRFRLTDSTIWELKKDFWTGLFELQIFDSKIEKAADFGNCQFTLQLSRPNSCTRLTSLELEIPGTLSPGKDVFVYLENMPVLKDFRLHRAYIGIDDCELLHKNIPALENLTMSISCLKPGEVPSNVIPATSVKNFSANVSEVRNIVTNPNWYPSWYVYLAKKYTDLIVFDYKDPKVAGVNPNQAMTIYRDGVLPLYKNLRKRQLDKFNAVNVPTEIGIFNKLEEFGFKFESLRLTNNRTRPIFTQLAESNLSMHVEDLFLGQTIIYSPILFQKFTSLKSLFIYYSCFHDDLDISLTDVLNVIPPSLTSFVAHLGRTKINKLPTCSNNVEEFNLNSFPINPTVCEIISNYLPMLNNLHLSGTVTENLNINLPNNHFKDLSIEAFFNQNNALPHTFSITSANSPWPQNYIGEYYVDENESTGCNFALVPATAGDLQNRVNINVKYHTADQTRFYTVPSFGY